MNKKIILCFIFFVTFYTLFMHKRVELCPLVIKEGIDVIDEIIPIKLSDYKPYNPGVISIGERYLLVTREKAKNFFEYLLLKGSFRRKNVIMITELDSNFNQVEKMVQLIPQKEDGMTKVSDPRLFTHEGEIYMVFCDHSKGGSIQTLARLEKSEGVWRATSILPLSYEYTFSKYIEKGVEKNWMPFSKDGKLYAVYLMEPQTIVLEINLTSGICSLISKTENLLVNAFSPLRGGTPLIFDEEMDQYLTFYHIPYRGRRSFTPFKKNSYICGAATFTKEAPFTITGRTMGPFYQKNLYNNYKKIIFPTALIRKGENYLLFYGEDDCRIKLAKINRKKLISKIEGRENGKWELFND